MQTSLLFLLALVLSSAKGTNQHLRSNKVTNIEDEHSEAALKDEIIDLVSFTVENCQGAQNSGSCFV